MTTHSFSDTDLQTLANICTSAATRYNEFARTLRASPPGSAALSIAEQFGAQANEASRLASIFMNAEPFEVTYESA